LNHQRRPHLESRLNPKRARKSSGAQAIKAKLHSNAGPTSKHAQTIHVRLPSPRLPLHPALTRRLSTGATGFIGGDALAALAAAHPEFSLSCLVRGSAKGARVAAAFPRVRLVYGTLDDAPLLRAEAAAADVVCHFADCDHEGAAAALVEGLAAREGGAPGWPVHTSGTGILTVGDVVAGRCGGEGGDVFDDWEGVGAVTELPDEAWHRKVDKIVLGAATHGNVKTAIVCPPTIYGVGRGPDKTDSDQWPRMAEAALQRGKGFCVGEGKNRWTHVHVHDLSDLFLRLIDAAVKQGGDATWNDKGYYFCESGEYVWEDMAKKIAAESKKQGFIKTDEIDHLSKEEADELTPHGSAKWGMNSRCKAIRGNKLLGWKPTSPSPVEELPGMVKIAAEKLGLVKSHAAIAAGDV